MAMAMAMPKPELANYGIAKRESVMSVSQTPTTIFTRTNNVGPDISALTQLSAAKPEFGFDEVMAQQRERKNTERDSDVKAHDRADRTKHESKPKESAGASVKQEASEPGSTPDATPDTTVESKAVAADETDDVVNDQPTEEPLEAEGKDQESQQGEAESEPPEEETAALAGDAELESEVSVLADSAALTPQATPQAENQESQAEAALVGAEGEFEETVLDEHGLAEEKSNSPARPETLVDPTITSEPVGTESGTAAEALTTSAAAASQASGAKAPTRAEQPVEMSSSSAGKVTEPAHVMTPSSTVAEPLVADSSSGFSISNRGFGAPTANPSMLAQAAENSDSSNAVTFGELKAGLSPDGAADNKAQVDPKTPQAPLKSAAGLALDLASTLTSSDPARQVALKEAATTSSSTAIEGPRIAASTLSQFQTGSVRGAQVQVSVQTPVGQQPQWGSAVAEKVLWMAAQNLKSAEIHLDPPELGPMMVKVTVSQDQASVTFASQQVAVREALDQTAFRLREQFDEQGLNLANVDVTDQGFGQEANDDQEGNGQGSAQASGAEGSEEERTVPVGEEVGIVDYFV